MQGQISNVGTQSILNSPSDFYQKSQVKTNQVIRRMGEEIKLMGEENRGIRNSKGLSSIANRKNDGEKKEVSNQVHAQNNSTNKSKTQGCFIPINWSNSSKTEAISTPQLSKTDIERQLTFIQKKESKMLSNDNVNAQANYKKILDKAKQKIDKISSQNQNNHRISSPKPQSINQNNDSSNSNQSVATDASAKKQQNIIMNIIQNSKSLEKYIIKPSLSESNKNAVGQNQVNSIQHSNDSSTQKQNLQSNNILKIKNQISKVIAQQKIAASQSNIGSQNPSLVKGESSRQNSETKVWSHPHGSAASQQNLLNLQGSIQQFNSQPPSVSQNMFQNRNRNSLPINNIFQPNSVSQSIFTQSGIQNPLYFQSVQNVETFKAGITPFSTQNLRSLRWQHHRMKIMQILANKPYQNSYKQLIAIMTSNVDEQQICQLVEKHHLRLAELAQLIIGTSISRKYLERQQYTNLDDKNINAYNISDLINNLQNFSNQLHNSEDKEAEDAEILQQYEAIKNMTVIQFQHKMTTSIEQSFQKLHGLVCFEVEADNYQIHSGLNNIKSVEKDYYQVYNQLMKEINIIQHKQDKLDDYLSLLQSNLYQNYYTFPKHDVTYLIEAYFESQAQLQEIKADSEKSNQSRRVDQLSKQLIQSMILSLNELLHEITRSNIRKINR